MGLIKEPIDVDFTVDSRPLTREEEETINEFIQNDKRNVHIRKTQKPKRKLVQKRVKV